MESSIVATYTVAQLCDEFLADRVDEDVISTIRRHKITGDFFLSLDEDQLVELFPIIGDRMAVRKLINEIKREDAPVRDESPVRSSVLS